MGSRRWLERACPHRICACEGPETTETLVEATCIIKANMCARTIDLHASKIPHAFKHLIWIHVDNKKIGNTVNYVYLRHHYSFFFFLFIFILVAILHGIDTDDICLQVAQSESVIDFLPDSPFSPLTSLTLSKHLRLGHHLSCLPCISFPITPFQHTYPFFASHGHTASTSFPGLSLSFPHFCCPLDSLISYTVELCNSTHPL